MEVKLRDQPVRLFYLNHVYLKKHPFFTHMIPFLAKYVAIQPVFFKMVELKKQIFPPERFPGRHLIMGIGQPSPGNEAAWRDYEDPPVCPLIRPQN